MEDNLVAKSTKFDDFSLDSRLLKAITKMNIHHPTLVQEKAIPLALAGKDIIAKARTGSGKTLAYVIPILQKMLASPANGVKTAILVPTKELVNQVTQYANQLSVYCSKSLNVINALNVSVFPEEVNQIVVATPTKLLNLLANGAFSCKETLTSLVFDEADLMLSYGYEDDIKKLLGYLPSIYQAFLISATLSPEVQTLKQMFIRNPVTLSLQDSEEDTLIQYFTKSTADGRFLYLFYLLKLKVHPFGDGKIIIFTNELSQSYRVRLFLEQFGIRSCVLNGELPVESRFHVVQEFNKGVYDILIATDVIEQDDDEDHQPVHNKQRDAEFGVSRGIDFHNVQCVINFDLPASTRSYMHRVGRTARGGKKGFSLSFVSTDSKELIEQKDGSAVSKEEFYFEKISKSQKKAGRDLVQYVPDEDGAKAFEYRVEDALRAVTKQSIREARMKHLKMEILSSEKLKAHFEENPADKDILKHDKTLLPRHTNSLRHIPNYLLPKRQRVDDNDFVGQVRFHEKGGKRRKSTKKSQAKTKDPLKSFAQ